MTQWYYSDYDRNRHGPVAASDLAQLHASGQLRLDTLVWREGLLQWQPWQDVMGEVLGEAQGLAPLPEADLPKADLPEAKTTTVADTAPSSSTLSAGVNPYAIAEPVVRPVTASAASSADPSATQPYSPYAPPRASVQESDGNYVGGGEVVYAGFWKRYAALCIDGFLVGIAFYIVMIVAMIAGFGVVGLSGAGADGMGLGFAALMIGAYLMYPLISGLYYISMESSSLQATLGKLAVGIKVTDSDGHRLARGQALGRWASHLLCYFTLYIGYIMAGFTDRKRGLHDMVAGTLVVDKWAYTAHPERQRRELGAVAIVLICLSVLAILGYFAIIAAVMVPAFAGRGG
ncbi:RDD family protein [Lysobacter fragariae]